MSVYNDEWVCYIPESEEWLDQRRLKTYFILVIKPLLYIFYQNLKVQGYPHRTRLQRRLYGIFLSYISGSLQLHTFFLSYISGSLQLHTFFLSFLYRFITKTGIWFDSQGYPSWTFLWSNMNWFSIFVFLNCFFHLRFLRESVWRIYFLYGSNGETHRNKQSMSSLLLCNPGKLLSNKIIETIIYTIHFYYGL